MRTSEFRKAIGDLGFTVDDNCDYGFNIDNEHDTIACVSDKVEYNVDTDWYHFEKTELEKREELLSILVEYASTPIAEREEEKRYRLKLVNKTITEGCYMGYKSIGNDYKTVTLNFVNFSTRDFWKTIFTESELKDIDETGFERVEVTE